MGTYLRPQSGCRTADSELVPRTPKRTGCLSGHGAGSSVGGEPAEGSPGLHHSLQCSGAGPRGPGLAVLSRWRRGPRRKNQAESPRKHGTFNHAGQAGQGADGGERCAALALPPGQALLRPPATQPWLPWLCVSTRDHGGPSSWDLQKHRWLEAISLRGSGHLRGGEEGWGPPGWPTLGVGGRTESQMSLPWPGPLLASWLRGGLPD